MPALPGVPPVPGMAGPGHRPGNVWRAFPAAVPVVPIQGAKMPLSPAGRGVASGAPAVQALPDAGRKMGVFRLCGLSPRPGWWGLWGLFRWPKNLSAPRGAR